MSVLALLLAASAAGRGTPVAGTYQISVCTSPCEGTDALVRGQLVLWDSSLNLATLPKVEVDYLLDESMFILDGRKPSACFVLETIDEHTKTLAGISRVGFTWWKLSADILTVQLYGSPDASSIAFGVLVGDDILAGEPEASLLLSSTPYHRDFLVGRRTGGPNAEVCVSAARLARQSSKQ